MYEDISKAAQTSANTFKDSLQYLVDAQNQQRILDQQAATQRYQNLLNQINQQREPLQTQFAADSQAAYINKMLAGQQVNQSLNQLGLNTQGFGVSQQLANETAYGQNLNQLMVNRNQALQNIDNQLINATGEYGAGQTELESMYAGRLNDLNKYITEATQNRYDTVYSQRLADKQYQDSLAQLAWENEYKNKQLAEQKRQANLNYETSKIEFGDNPKDNNDNVSITATNNYGNSEDIQKSNDYYFTAANGKKYQPRYIDNIKLTNPNNMTAKSIFSNSPYPDRKIWFANGRYYIWDGKGDDTGQYADITSQVTKSLNQKVSVPYA